MASHQCNNELTLFKGLLYTPAFSLHLRVCSPGSPTQDNGQNTSATAFKLCDILMSVLGVLLPLSVKLFQHK